MLHGYCVCSRDVAELREEAWFPCGSIARQMQRSRMSADSDCSERPAMPVEEKSREQSSGVGLRAWKHSSACSICECPVLQDKPSRSEKSEKVGLS